MKLNILEALDRLGKEGRGNGTAILSVTKYANVPPGATSEYGPLVRQKINIFVSLGRGRYVSVDAESVEEAFKKAERSVMKQRDPLAEAA
jgi:hypothetical protein